MSTSGTRGTGQPIILNDDELLLINNALNEILNGPSAISEREFHTRTGVDIAHAKDLLRRLRAMLNERDNRRRM